MTGGRSDVETDLLHQLSRDAVIGEAQLRRGSMTTVDSVLDYLVSRAYGDPARVLREIEAKRLRVGAIERRLVDDPARSMAIGGGSPLIRPSAGNRLTKSGAPRIVHGMAERVYKPRWTCRLHVWHRWRTYRDHAAGPDGGQFQQCTDCGKIRDVPMLGAGPGPAG